MKQWQTKIILAVSMLPSLALGAAESSAHMQQALAVLHARATKENLKLIVGNGTSAVKSWQVPPHDNLKIIAEGGSTLINASSDNPVMVLEVQGDANILEYFVATKTPEGEFRVLPKEGFLLASNTPVVLHLLMPNGSLPRMSTKIGTRVVSLPAKDVITP